jgi:YihY family inner membrane protein
MGPDRRRAILGRLDRWQRRRRWAGFTVAVARKFVEDRASRHATRIAYYAFFSVFPLLLAFVSIVGFVLQGDPSRRADVLDSAYAEMPVIGPLVRSDVGTITGSGIALVVGIGVALWAGLGVTLAFGQALDETWNVPPFEQLGYVSRRVRGLAVLVAAGLAIAAGSVLGGLTVGGEVGGPGWAAAAELAVSIAIDAAALLAAFRLLATQRRPLRQLLPGVLVATAGLFVLQSLGAWYVSGAISRASDTYGLFATVIGLLSWLSLAALLVLVAAEVNAVAALRLWPRSLAGDPTEADTRALEFYAQSARRDPRARVDAHWAADDPPVG